MLLTKKDYGRKGREIGDRTFTERTAKKYTKRLKGQETLEAKTDLN